MRWEPKLGADKRTPELALVTSFVELVDVVKEAEEESVGFFLRVTGVGLHNIDFAEEDFVDAVVGSFSLSVKIEDKSWENKNTKFFRS